MAENIGFALALLPNLNTVYLEYKNKGFREVY